MREDLLAALHTDHEKTRDAFQALKGESDAEERIRRLFNLETVLLPHMLAEENSLYRRLKSQRGEIAEEVLESIAEHHAVRLVLRDLAETPANDEFFPAKVRVLEEMVEHHIQEEEGEIFREVRQYLPENESDDILRQFRHEKENAPCEPAGKGWWGGY